MIADAQRIMQDKLLFATSLPVVPLAQIADDVRNVKFGYSFITERPNGCDLTCLLLLNTQ